MKPSAEARIAAISTNLRRVCGQNVPFARGAVESESAVVSFEDDMNACIAPQRICDNEPED